MLRIGRLTLGAEPPDVVRTLLYRPKFFGTAYRRLLQKVMRQSPHWRPIECELMASFVSRLNQCPF